PRGGPRTRQILARDLEPAVRLRADGVDHRVEHAQQLLVRHVASDLHVPEEAEAVEAGRALESLRGGLELGMVRRDAPADEAPRGRQPLDQVDLDLEVALEQRVGGVEPGGPGPDDGNAKTHEGAPSPGRRRRARLMVAAAAGFAVVDLEAVAAAAGARGVRV